MMRAFYWYCVQPILLSFGFACGFAGADEFMFVPQEDTATCRAIRDAGYSDVSLDLARFVGFRRASSRSAWSFISVSLPEDQGSHGTRAEITDCETGISRLIQLRSLGKYEGNNTNSLIDKRVCASNDDGVALECVGIYLPTWDPSQSTEVRVKMQMVVRRLLEDDGVLVRNHARSREIGRIRSLLMADPKAKRSGAPWPLGKTVPCDLSAKFLVNEGTLDTIVDLIDTMDPSNRKQFSVRDSGSVDALIEWIKNRDVSDK